MKKKRKDKTLNILTSLQEQMPNKYKRLNDIAQARGSSSWLTVLPIKEIEFSLSKAEFWDAVYLRYKTTSTKTTCKYKIFIIKSRILGGSISTI